LTRTYSGNAEIINPLRQLCVVTLRSV